MQIPEKTFLTLECTLGESDFEFNGEVKPFKIMQLMQDVATEHAEKLGVGWHALDDNCKLWVLSKVKTEFFCPVTRNTLHFTLYTWPLAPTKFYAERCFTAKCGNELLFSTCSLWSMVDRNSRKIVPATTMNDFYHGEYSAVRADTDGNFRRVRKNENFAFCYEKTVRRSDLDQNGHVNNTNYIVFAEDVLSPEERIRTMEITYHRELKLGEVVRVFASRNGNLVEVVGERDGETCFTVVFALEN